IGATPRALPRALRHADQPGESRRGRLLHLSLVVKACFTWFILIAGFIFLMVTLLRWFEQITEAVDLGWWNKVTMLVFMPFTVWFFPSSTTAGRPTPFPRHEPVRGFGTLGRSKPPPDSQPEPPLAEVAPSDQPPPG